MKKNGIAMVAESGRILGFGADIDCCYWVLMLFEGVAVSICNSVILMNW